MSRPVALVTGVGRTVGIGAAIAVRLAEDGWDVATSHWTPYDERMPWGVHAEDPATVGEAVRAAGAATVAVPADLTDVSAPARLLETVGEQLGPVTALVMSHAESVDSGLLDTTVESFDRHFAVNVRASWLLVKAFAEQYPLDTAEPGSGRVVALTSDHVVGNMPYGASKGALDRIVIAAARELQHLKVTANVVNPGPVDTGWMDEPLKEWVVGQTPLARLGTPRDIAGTVSFLLSAPGGWVNGQLLYANGGFEN
jgi:3-oxoacyl-[acyl-carrier protein] reductase